MLSEASIYNNLCRIIYVILHTQEISVSTELTMSINPSTGSVITSESYTKFRALGKFWQSGLK